MRDPFPIPPIPFLSRAVQPFADKCSLHALPLHIHEVLFAVGLYTFVHVVLSPWISNRWFPSYYPSATLRSKRVSWNSHVVSLVQSVLVNTLSLWVMAVDQERKNMDWEQRIWGYTGATGMVQSFALGYFVWDLAVTALNVDVFGVGLLAHAVSAMLVYLFSFRPFLNYYGCVFVLYELSTPFLNIHWFFDKLHMTGSRVQLYNGITLLLMFFSARLVYGNMQSAFVYRDMWRAVHNGPTITPVNASVVYGNEDIMFFAKDAPPLPVWLAVVYVSSNLVLNILNLHWFYQMILAVRKRFEPAAKDRDQKQKDKAKTHAGASTAAKTGLDRLDGLHRRTAA